MAESGINGDWTKNNTISSLITNAFTSQFFDENGNLLEAYSELFDEEGQIDSTKISALASKFIDRYNELLNGLGEDLDSFVQVIENVNKGQYTAEQLEKDLEDFGIKKETDKELYNELLIPIQKAIERTKNKITESGFIPEDKNLDNLLDALPTTVLNSLSSFITDLQNKIENKQIS